MLGTLLATISAAVAVLVAAGPGRAPVRRMRELDAGRARPDDRAGRSPLTRFASAVAAADRWVAAAGRVVPGRPRAPAR